MKKKLKSREVVRWSPVGYALRAPTGALEPVYRPWRRSAFMALEMMAPRTGAIGGKITRGHKLKLMRARGWRVVRVRLVAV